MPASSTSSGSLIFDRLEQLPPVNISELTKGELEGDGVFDQLMRAAKEHVHNEHTKGRLKGPEYATVYLGLLEHVLGASVQYLTVGRKAALEALLVEKQIELAGVEVDIKQAELQIAQLNVTKVPHEIDLLKAQVTLTTQQAANAVVEQDVLRAQICKLKGEYDLLMAQIQKGIQEGALIAAKVATENAQTKAMGVDADSVIGKQKALYAAQTDGFKRDAEQKAAKTMIDSWSVRRTTDEATVADGTNQLHDAAIGRAVSKLLSGVGA